jgi:UDP-glucuronate 4-epimerase
VSRLLVTGVAGFIGSHLTEFLLGRGDVVIGVDSFDPMYPRAVKERNLARALRTPGFTLYERDIRDAGALDGLLDPGTVVVHLAARAGVRPSLADPAGYASQNVVGAAAVAAAAVGAGARRLVFASSSSVYGDDTPAPYREDAAAMAPVSPYGATKRAAELLLGAMAATRGMAVASLRMFTVYGPRQRPDLAIHAFARKMATGEPVTMFGDGTARRDYTYVDDMVAGIAAAADWTHEAPPGVEHVNLAGGRPVGLRGMITVLSRALGVAPRIVAAPAEPGDMRHTEADLRKARSMLGWAPRTTFEDGIERFAEWFREEYAAQR